MLLLRVEMPDTPGSLGAVATAIGSVGVGIEALEIIQRDEGYALTDLILRTPTGMMPDTLISACTALADVDVIWVSRYPDTWGLESDIEMMDRMLEAPGTAAQSLTFGAPTVFHCQWALLLNEQGQTLEATNQAPELGSKHVALLGDLTVPHTVELSDGWMPQWGSVVCALSPVSGNRTLVVGRQGGPEWLPTELARLRMLAMVPAEG